MLPAAFAFSGGLLAAESLSKSHLPQIRRAQESSVSFRLSLRIVSASVPALGKPGLLSQRRPRLEVSLGDVQKDTELGDYVEDDGSSPEADACARECPWRFGDTLTFVANLKDVLGPGLRFRLRAHSDILLGPVQLQLQRVADLGEGCASLRNRVLPACVRDRHTTAADSWESPILPVPLSHVRGGEVSADHELGEAVAHITVVFKLDMDPEELIELADDQVRPIGEIMARRAGRMTRWAFESPDQADSRDIDNFDSPEPWEICSDVAPTNLCAFCLEASPEEEDAPGLLDRTLTGPEIQHALLQATHRNVQRADRPISAPDKAPQGWLCRKGPNGRLYWHHSSLGPAPWEQDAIADAPSCRSSIPIPRGMGPIVSPSLPDDGWVAHQGPGGRLNWHHRSLGPAPWEQANNFPSTLPSVPYNHAGYLVAQEAARPPLWPTPMRTTI